MTADRAEPRDLMGELRKSLEKVRDDRARATRAELRALLPHLPVGLAGYIIDGLYGEVIRAPRDGEPDEGDPRGYPVVMSWDEEDGGACPSPNELDAICAAVNALPELLDAADERDKLIASRDLYWRDHGDIAGQRDRARAMAVALEAENAELRTLSVWLVGLDEPVNSHERRVVTLADVIDRARAVLARTDPLRAEDGGETDG